MMLAMPRGLYVWGCASALLCLSVPLCAMCTCLLLVLCASLFYVTTVGTGRVMDLTGNKLSGAIPSSLTALDKVKGSGQLTRLLICGNLPSFKAPVAPTDFSAGVVATC